MSKFSILLKEVINQSNNTIYSIAKDINYDRATLTNQINGKRKMSKEIFLKVINNINITENTKQKLISAFHKEYLGENYNTFEIIKKSFISYSEISYLRNINLDMTVTNNTHISIPTGKISGKLYVVNSIQNIIANEFQNDNPCLFINLDTSNQDILTHITKTYTLYSSIKNINTVSSTLLSCYKKINTMISYCPVESIIEFAKSGKDGHTDNPLAKPLTKEMRIDVLKRIQYAINNGMRYYFVNKNNIFCNNLTFNIISDSKIVFFSYDDKIATKQNISVITTPSGLLNELKNFFYTLNKSCYVLSKSDAIRELERGIEFIKNMN